MQVRVRTQNSDALREARAQGNDESLANAASVLIAQDSLHTSRRVSEQVSQFYRTSAKDTVETNSVRSRFDVQNSSGRMDED